MVESCDTLPVEMATVCAVPKLANWVVLRPPTCEEVTALNWVAVKEAKELALMEPIWVLVRALTTLVDSAATSALLNPDKVVVDRAEACAVVKAPYCAVLRLEMTELSCVLVRAPTCEPVNAVTDRAANCVVDSWEISLVVIAVIWAVTSLVN